MKSIANAGIRGIIFDLDGTLYVSEEFAATIQEAAVGYVAGLRAITKEEAWELITVTRKRLSEEQNAPRTLSAVCAELGGSAQELHTCFEANLRPESYLVRDERVIALIRGLSERFTLAIYTNNNRPLATRIISYLGLDGMIDRLFTIDDTWIAKPDERMIGRILVDTGLAPSEALFVGDRYEVDLRLPEQAGCTVYLSQSIEQLLRLGDLLGSG